MPVCQTYQRHDLSVIRLMVSGLVVMPYISLSALWMSRTVIPRAYGDDLVFQLVDWSGRTCASARSASLGPALVFTVRLRLPLRELPLLRPFGSYRS